MDKHPPELDRLRSIINRLGWYGILPCPNEHPVRYSVLDSSMVSDDGVRCPECGSGLAGDLRVSDRADSYRSLFQDAIEILATIIVGRSHFGCELSVVLAHTSLEIFLRQAVKRALEQSSQDARVISFVLNDMRPDIKTYVNCLSTLEALAKNAQVEKHLNGLRQVSNWRNAFIHRADPIDTDHAVRACERVAEAFLVLSALIPPDQTLLENPEEI